MSLEISILTSYVILRDCERDLCELGFELFYPFNQRVILVNLFFLCVLCLYVFIYKLYKQKLVSELGSLTVKLERKQHV